ncbi:MAG: hypothetical protein ACREED_00365 [Stellaceae bacterium]
MSETDTTYRLVVLGNPDMVGRTAASPELAKLVPGDIPTRGRTERLGMERTEWVQHFEKMKVNRSILVTAESRPNEWTIGT